MSIHKGILSVMSIFIIAAMLCITGASVYATTQEERVTLTTYYPAPYGEYTALKAKAMGIGTADSYFKNSVSDKNLVVEGKVGVGTSAPESVLDVRGEMVLDQGRNAVIYTGRGSSELNRYLHLLNSPGAKNRFRAQSRRRIGF